MPSSNSIPLLAVSLLICASGISPLAAQLQEERRLIATAGATSRTSEGYVFAWTLGDLATEISFGTTRMLTQGFLQPEILGGTGIEPAFASVLSLHIYPNPSSGELWIENTASPSGLYALSITDLAGRLMATHTLALPLGEKTGITTTMLSPGLYRVVISDLAGKESANFLIIMQ